jgi:hypothetical protein
VCLELAEALSDGQDCQDTCICFFIIIILS